VRSSRPARRRTSNGAGEVGDKTVAEHGSRRGLSRMGV
jgi:hypothetical protein